MQQEGAVSRAILVRLAGKFTGILFIGPSTQSFFWVNIQGKTPMYIYGAVRGANLVIIIINLYISGGEGNQDNSVA